MLTDGRGNGHGDLATREQHYDGTARSERDLLCNDFGVCCGPRQRELTAVLGFYIYSSAVAIIGTTTGHVLIKKYHFTNPQCFRSMSKMRDEMRCIDGSNSPL